MAAVVLRFGQVVVDPVQRRVLVAGRPVSLGARAFDVLLALIAHRDRVVSKDELLDAAWPGLVVEEANVQVQVSGLRAALGRDAIATVPGLGYRLTLAADDMGTDRPAAEVAADATTAAPSDNLPSTDGELLGRDADCMMLASDLAAHRLVTIAGPAGIGKTRVALAVARRVGERFADGVWWVDLAALASTDQIAGAVAVAAGLPLGPGDAEAGLARALRRRHLLLVLDNCEHLLAGVARLVRTCLDAAPQIRVLSTSQVPLNLGAEQCYRLDALALPAAGASPAAARQAPALALLLRRARAIDRRFTIDDATLPLAVSICRQLDGVPLAIELAAARLPMLGVQALHGMLDQRFALLRHTRADLPLRQQALQAALDWSNALLSPPELKTLQCLSTFAAGFRLDSAAAVVDATRSDAIDALSSLVDKSLVQVEQREPPRYRLLDSTRLYAARGLLHSSDAPAARARRRSAMVKLARECERALWVTPDAAWIAAYQGDHADLAAAFDECIVHGEAEAAGVIGDALYQWDHVQSMGDAIRRRKEAALRLVAGAGTQPCAELCNVLVFYAEIQLDGLDCVAASERRRAAWRQRAEPWQLYRALGALAVLRAVSADAAAASQLLAEAQALGRPSWPARLLATGAYQAALVAMYLGDAAGYLRAALLMLELASRAGATHDALLAQMMAADARAMLGEHAQAIAMLQAAVAETRVRGHPINEAVALAMLSSAHALAGDVEPARATAAQAWPPAREHEFPRALMGNGVLIAALAGQPAVAARLLGYTTRPSAARAPMRWHNELQLLLRAEAELRQALGAAALAALREQGAQLDDAAALALLESVLFETA